MGRILDLVRGPRCSMCGRRKDSVAYRARLSVTRCAECAQAMRMSDVVDVDVRCGHDVTGSRIFVTQNEKEWYGSNAGKWYATWRSQYTRGVWCGDAKACRQAHDTRDLAIQCALERCTIWLGGCCDEPSD